MSEPMKAITLWQPWASLWAAGIKRFETRSWATMHRGPLAIHAAKLDVNGLVSEIGPREYDLLNCICVRQGLGHIRNLPRGSIVGSVEVRKCAPIVAVREGSLMGFIQLLAPNGDRYGALDGASDLERSLGDYSPGRFAWIGAHHRAIEPIPYRGGQRIWTLPDRDLLPKGGS